MNYFKQIHGMIAAANGFMRTLFHCALWLSQGERDHLIQCGNEVAKLYKKCANFAYRAGFTRWKLQPKYHMMGEIIFQLEDDKRHERCSMSPLSSSTQMDEDLVGHISKASRHVSIRTLHERTLGRYKVALATHWGETPSAHQSLG